MEGPGTTGNPCQLENLDRKGLSKALADALPEIRERMGISHGDLERATNIGSKRIAAFEEGRQTPKWSEYLSLLFVFWSNEKSRGIIEEEGLFPEELKQAFSVNRNAHGAGV